MKITYYLINDLKKRLGTNFYNVGLYTKGGILLHPGKLVRAMIDTLPSNVNLLENSFLINWKINNGKIICEFKKGTIKSKKNYICYKWIFKISWY